MKRLGWLKPALVALGLMACAPGAWGQQSWEQFLSDPARTLRNVSPAPEVLWEPKQALPQVPAPENTPRPSSSTPLTLAELTEYALRNNPRARQAWHQEQRQKEERFFHFKGRERFGVS